MNDIRLEYVCWYIRYNSSRDSTDGKANHVHVVAERGEHCVPRYHSIDPIRFDFSAISAIAAFFVTSYSAVCTQLGVCV